MSPIHDEPTMRKEVPSKAVKIRKMKSESMLDAVILFDVLEHSHATRLGESAVPKEQSVNRKAVVMQICMTVSGCRCMESTDTTDKTEISPTML